MYHIIWPEDAYSSSSLSSSGPPAAAAFLAGFFFFLRLLVLHEWSVPCADFWPESGDLHSRGLANRLLKNFEDLFVHNFLVGLVLGDIECWRLREARDTIFGNSCGMFQYEG